MNESNLNLTLDERNGQLTALIPNIIEAITNAPDLKPLDKVKANPLGLKAGIAEPGEIVIIAAIDPVFGRATGDPSRTCQLWCLETDGELRYQVVDPRLLEKIESCIPQPAAPKKPATKKPTTNNEPY